MTVVTPGPYSGRIARLYMNVSGSTPGTRAAPTWVQIAFINGDQYTPAKKNFVEGECRSQWRKFKLEGGSDLASLKFSYMPQKSASDPVYTALIALSAPGAAHVEFAVADDVITYTGCQYDKFFGSISKTAIDRDLGKIVSVDFEVSEVSHYEAGSICNVMSVTV